VVDGLPLRQFSLTLARQEAKKAQTSAASGRQAS